MRCTYHDLDLLPLRGLKASVIKNVFALISAFIIPPPPAEEYSIFPLKRLALHCKAFIQSTPRRAEAFLADCLTRGKTIPPLPRGSSIAADKVMKRESKKRAFLMHVKAFGVLGSLKRKLTSLLVKEKMPETVFAERQSSWNRFRNTRTILQKSITSTSTAARVTFMASLHRDTSPNVSFFYYCWQENRGLLLTSTSVGFGDGAEHTEGHCSVQRAQPARFHHVPDRSLRTHEPFPRARSCWSQRFGWTTGFLSDVPGAQHSRHNPQKPRSCLSPTQAPASFLTNGIKKISVTHLCKAGTTLKELLNSSNSYL